MDGSPVRPRAGLFQEMGGRTKAAQRLNFFLRELTTKKNATHTNHALLGDEPNLDVPWLYEWTRRPYGTQEAVRRAILTLYNTSPSGYPGNDDLGTMSAWYVFGALGIYPEVPGVGLLAIGSPLFPARRSAFQTTIRYDDHHDGLHVFKTEVLNEA